MSTVVRVYDHLSDAQDARDQLLQSGFPPSSINLDATGDEAGPTEGNGILDDKDTGKGPRRRFTSSASSGGALLSGEDRTDAYNNSEPVWRSSIMLTVDAEDDEQRARACGIMDGCGATDVAARADMHRGSQRPATS